MPETNEAREAFEKYLKENEGKPVSPIARDAARREMELGAKGGFAVYGDEPDKRKLAESYPEGELYKTDMSELELGQEVTNLTNARNVVVGYLNNPTVPGFDHPKDTTILAVENLGSELPKDLASAISNMSKNEIHADVLLYDIPQEIEEVIKKYTIIAEHLHNKASN
jgi:hypothetical protein